MEVLLFNMFLYVVYTIWGFKRCKYLTVHNAISCWFCFISFMGVLSVQLGCYQQVFGELRDLPITPYVLCFICFLFLMLPLRKLNFASVEICDFPLQQDEHFFKILYVPFIFLFAYTIAYIPSVITALSYEDISDIYYSQRVEGESIYQFSSAQMFLISSGRKFFNWFFGVLLFYCLYYLDDSGNSTRKKIVLVLMLLSAILPYFLRTVSTGGRGGFVFFSAKIVFVILPLWTYLTMNYKKQVIRLGALFVTLGLIYALVMTFSRFEYSSSGETPLTSIVRYFGEPYPNLGNNLWGQIQNYLMGHRMYPELFGYSLDSSNSQYDNFRYWQNICGVAVLNYKTIFGDFYLEFGPFWAVLIVAIIGVLMNKYLVNEKLSFYQLPLYTYYIDICVTAPLWFNRRNTGDILIIFQCLIISFLLSRFINQKKSLS